jgi:hypothetical protein
MMAETEKFELEISVGATITIFDDAKQPVDWLRPATTLRHTWRGMPTLEEMELRYNAMMEIATVTLNDVLVHARERAIEASQDR